MEIINCIHGLASYYIDEYTVKHTCDKCYSKRNEMNPLQRIQNYGYNDKITGEYCDEKTLELLKNNCYITVRVPSDLIDEIYNDYYLMTNEEINYEFVREDIAENTWMAYSFNIAFYNNDEMQFNSHFNLCNRGNQTIIYSNQLAGFLFDNGFKLGYN